MQECWKLSGELMMMMMMIMATRIGKELVDSDVKHSKCDQVKQKTSE
jgi:hypothetical protein